MDKQREESEKKKRIFHAQEAPDFAKLHERFLGALEKKKKAAHPTVPKPFNFKESKKKISNCEYLNWENKPEFKNPDIKRKKNINVDEIRKRMTNKPKIEPSSTKSLKLLMETRRKELEQRKKDEENLKREDMLRKQKQNRLNERVRSSSVLVSNKKQRALEIANQKKTFMENLKRGKENYKEKLEIINQNVANRPLLFEIETYKRNINGMKQDKNIQRSIEECKK